MARIAVQFVANSNMGSVVKDIAAINAQLATMAAQLQRAGATNPAGVKSLGDTFRRDVANIRGYETATMSARTVTSQLTDEINRQKIQMKDLAKVRKNLPALGQEQMRLQNSSAMITGRDLATGRAMGELIMPTNTFARSAKVAALEAGIMARAIESAGIQATAAGKRMMWTGRQLSTGITTPIVAVAAVSAKAAYDIDAAMVRLTKVYGDLGGASESELTSVREATMDTARVVAQEFGIAGKATVTLAADLAAAGYKGEALQESVKEIQRISLLGELDQQKAMQATRTIQTVFGISTEELAGKFNFLNAVENQTSTSLQDLTEVIPRTAGVIKDLGGSLEDSAIFTVAFKEAGIDAVQGANALRSSLGAIVAPSGVAQKRLNALGIDIRRIAAENNPENGGKGLTAMLQQLGAELEGLTNLERQEALAVLFGRYQFNKMGGLLKGLAEDANDAGTQVGRAFQLTAASSSELAAVADREIKAIQESLSGRLRRAGADIVLTFAEIGRPVLKLVVAIVEGFAAVLNVLNSFPSVLKTTIGVMLGILALAGPFLFFKGVFKALYGVVMTWVGGMRAGRAGVGELQTAQSAFAAHAATAVIPTINAEAAAVTKLGAAMAVAGRQAGMLANEQARVVATGAAAGTTAGVVGVPRERRRATREAGPAVVPVGGTATPVAPTGNRRATRPAGPPVSRTSPIATPGPIGTPGPVIAPAAARDVADSTDRAAKAGGVLRGHWSGIATSMVMIAPMMLMMSGHTGVWTQALLGASIVLMMFPSLLTAIAAKMVLVGRSAALAPAAAMLGRMKAGMGGLASGARIAAVATRVLSVAVKALMGPLGIVLIGLSLIMYGWKKYKESLEKARKEQENINKSAKSLSTIVGYEYKTAQQMATTAAAKHAVTLQEEAKRWIETGDAAKGTAKAIKEASEAKAKSIAMDIAADARANGGETSDARRSAEIALVAGGYTAKDAEDLVSSFLGEISTKADAEQYNMEKIGASFVKSMNEGGGKEARANQDLKDYGEKFAAQLVPGDNQQIIAKMNELKATVANKVNEIYDEVEMTAQTREMLVRMDINPDDKAAVMEFFKNEFPKLGVAKQNELLNVGVGGMLPQDVQEYGFALAEAAEAEEKLTQGVLKGIGATGEKYASIKTVEGALKAQVGSIISIANAEAYYKDALKSTAAENAEANAMRKDWNTANAAQIKSGKVAAMTMLQLGDAEKLLLLNTARAAAGLPPATKLLDGFGDASRDAAGDVEEITEAMKEGEKAAAEFASAMRSGLKSQVGDAIGILMDQFDNETEAYKDNIDAQNDIWSDGLEKRQKDSDKAFEARERRENKAFDEEERKMDERHTKALDDAEKTKDKRVKAIEDEMDKADKLDEQRKKMFEAELTRMQRLQAAANRSIDFNVALNTGNLDEAARIQEAAYVETVSNDMSDAGGAADAASEARRAAGQTRIAAVTTAEDARIARIKKAQDADKIAFDERKQRAKDELDDAKNNAKERFDAERQSYEASARSAAKSYDDARAARRKQTEAALQNMAIEIPTTEAGYRQLFKNLQGVYKSNTGVAAKETKDWTNLHATGFKQVMADTHRELRNQAAWEQTGKRSVDAMTQGMLGMTFQEFATWMQTGKMPDKKKPEGAKYQKTLPNGDIKVQGGTLPMRHSGGPVSNAQGSRGGRPMNAPLYPDEVPTILQRGEFVVQKKAVDKLGAGTLNALNSGQASFYHEGGMVGAAGMAIMDTFRNSMQTAIQTGANRKAAELATAGSYESIPEALQFVTSAAKAGKFGGSMLSDEQLRNAATIIGVGKSMGASDRDLLIGLMTAMQESMLRNISHGDRDSVGLFQQRTSQGWGTIEQIMDPKYASKKFFEGLLKIKGRGDMTLTGAAQAVQRSAYPDAYAKWEDEARAILAATMTGAGSGLNSGQYSGGGIFKGPGGGTVTGDIKGLNLEFLNRLARWSASVGQPYTVGSGYRSMAEQQILYDRYMAGVPGQAKAAPPGSSNHNYGLASDGPHWGGKNPGAFGLRYPMSFEPWHVEPVGAREMRIPQLRVGGTVNYDDTIANLHKNETVLTAPLSKKLENGINALDSGANVQYNINVNGAGADAETVANKVMQKIQRIEQTRGPKRVIR